MSQKISTYRTFYTAETAYSGKAHPESDANTVQTWQ